MFRTVIDSSVAVLTANGARLKSLDAVPRRESNADIGVAFAASMERAVKKIATPTYRMPALMLPPAVDVPMIQSVQMDARRVAYRRPRTVTLCRLGKRSTYGAAPGVSRLVSN